MNTVMEQTRDKMNIVIVGHVDHGKSTIIGRLLADTGSLPDGKLEQVKANCERNAKPFEFAFLIDALKDEQAQGITIDSARVFFKSAKRNYIIIDAPGHIEFLKNMVTGASRAEVALLVIDAAEGIQENSRRHATMLSMLGISKVVVLVNKMDLVKYDEATYTNIKRDFTAFLKTINITPDRFIPVSGREGDNVADVSPHMPWYTEKHTVLTALDSFTKEAPPEGKPFRVPVQDVYKFTDRGDDRRIIAGTVISGSLSPGDEVMFLPSGKSSTVSTIEKFNADVPGEIFAGEAVGFTTTEQIYVTRGEIAVRKVEARPLVSTKLKVSLFWLGHKPMETKKEYFLKLGTAKVRCRIEELTRIIDASDLDASITKDRIERHDVAECVLFLNRAIAFDTMDVMAETARFVIVDDYEITGGGIVLEAVADDKSSLRDSVILRNYKWETSMITMDERAEMYNQRATLVLITGPKDVGKKTVAKTLEKRLFTGGKKAYFLGIGNVLYGVDADIANADRSEYRKEHLRRMAEVAHIMLDAGIILIVTAVDLTQEDLQIIRATLGHDRIETVWVGEDVTTDIAYDLQVAGGQTAEESAVRIKHLLEDHGAILRP